MAGNQQDHGRPSDCPVMANSTMSRCQFTALLKQEDIELCLAKGLICRAVDQSCACQTPWASGSARPASIAVILVQPIRASRRATSALNPTGCVRKTVSSRWKCNFKAGGSALWQGAGAPERFPLISQLRDRCPIAWLFSQSGVVRSGFCADQQRQHKPGPRSQ